MTVTVTATAETAPVPHSGDAADDPAIWVHPTDVSQSTIVGTDKQGGLAVYDLAGRQLAYHADGNMNNVDLRHDFPLGGQSVALVAASNRSNNSIALYAVDPATRDLYNVAARTIPSGVAQVYGIAMYHSPVDGRYYAFVSDRNDGTVRQWELFDNGAGKVDARSVRDFDAGGTVEGMVADDVTGRFYAGEEAVGIWEYGAEPAAAAARTQVDHTGTTGHLTADVEGLGIYYAADGAGYLLASSQGSNDFNVYERQGAHRFVDKFRIASGAVDGVNDCDGLDVTSFGLGAPYPEGLVVVQDGSNDSGNQDFKLLDWGRLARAFSPSLLIDTTQDPRGGGETVTLPAAPSDLAATAASPRRVDLSWRDNSDNESGFRIERSPGGGAWAALTTVGAGVTTFADATVSPQATYSYRVAAVNAAGSSGPSNVAAATTPAEPPSTAVTFVPVGSEWKYLDDGSNQGAAWAGVGFDDAAWKGGPAQLGYGDGDEATVVNSGGGPTFVTTYFRRSFDVADPAAVTSLALRLLRDDGAAVYLNGREVARSNMPAGTINYTTPAASVVGGADEGAWHAFTVDPAALVAGRNVLAVEVHQQNTASTDISFDAGLTGTRSDQSPPPAPTAPAAPSALTATADSSARVLLSWSDNSGDESGFRVERSTDGTTWGPLATTSAGQAAFADAAVAPATTYHYRVAAFNAAGGSPYSDAASATTAAAPAPDPTVYSGPLVITRGGTYTGNWESLDPAVPAVSIRTTEPVVIENARVRGRGALIKTAVDHTRVTVRNTRGYGLNPGAYGLTPGRFFEGQRFDNVVLEHNYLEGTAGIKLLDYLGDHTAGNTVRIVANSALNIDGRKSDGAGGFLDFNKRTRLSDGVTETGYLIRQFVQLDKVQGVPAVEIAWNQVINEPGKSRVEDNVSIYKSSGTADSPIRIHDNYVQGAYNVKPWQASYSDSTWKYDWGYSGGGIMLGDGSSGVAYVEAYDNQVVATTNYGIAIAAGHDSVFHHNRVLSGGFLPDGRFIYKQNVGVYVWDLYGVGPSAFYNNSAHDNLVGWVNKPDGSRNDWWIPNATSFTNNTRWTGDITPATEAAEFGLWQAKAGDAGVVVGPT